MAEPFFGTPPDMSGIQFPGTPQPYPTEGPDTGATSPAAMIAQQHAAAAAAIKAQIMAAIAGQHPGAGIANISGPLGAPPGRVPRVQGTAPPFVRHPIQAPPGNWRTAILHALFGRGTNGPWRTAPQQQPPWRTAPTPPNPWRTAPVAQGPWRAT